MSTQQNDEDSEDAPHKTRKQLTVAEKQDLHEVFLLCDSDSSGLLDWTELHRALRGLGFPVSKKETRSLVREARKFKGVDGFIDRSQFIDIIEMLAFQNRLHSKEIKQAFPLFTSDTHITLESLRSLCAKVGEKYQFSDLEDMIAIADLNGDGKVSMKEFEEVMKRTNLFRSVSDEDDS
eukprot:m.41432 g.41432  ORF g.41432 m.41432 type:complete len:179 (-) comp9763_c0_seq2:171-707(-)